MNKAYFKIQDKAKNDRGFKFYKTTKSTLKTLDNLAGFIFDEDEYVYQGTTYPENEEYFGREYISTTNIYPIRFKVVNSTPLEGYWVQGNRTISPSRDALLQNISEGNFEEFVIDQVDSEEIAKIEKDEYDWVATDPVVIQKKLNFDPKILDDTMEILTLVDAGNNFFGVTAFSAVDSPYAQFPQKDVYDRSDLILYIGPKGRLLKDEGFKKLEFRDDNKFWLFGEYDVMRLI